MIASTTPTPSPSLWNLDIVDGTVLAVLGAASVALVVALIVGRVPDAASRGHGHVTRPWLRWFGRMAAAAGIGALVAVIVIVVAEDVLNVFGLPLDPDTHGWVIGAFAACGIAVANLWRSPLWRKIVAPVAIVVFVATATIGVNQGYGLDRTLGSLLDVQVAAPLALPHRVAPTASSTPVPQGPLWQTWQAPAGMPSAGSYGSVTIPATASGFVARPAWLYLPPAALTAHPPALPILIMMMGQPGGPESSNLFVPTLNALAAAHHGLAPIVLTVDQIGSPTKNPLCIDSKAGNVATYVMTDVVNYVKANLHVSTSRAGWAVGGYSNGGECALSFGAQHPDVFGSILDISGEIGPSLGSPAATIRQGFGGNVAAYTAAQPLTIMKATHYVDMTAIFTSGGNDSVYGPEGTTAFTAATAAGMTTYRFIGPGVGHRADAILFGLPKGLPVLFTRWQLAP